MNKAPYVAINSIYFDVSNGIGGLLTRDSKQNSNYRFILFIPKYL